jgi:hypothetical protein
VILQNMAIRMTLRLQPTLNVSLVPSNLAAGTCTKPALRNYLRRWSASCPQSVSICKVQIDMLAINMAKCMLPTPSLI